MIDSEFRAIRAPKVVAGDRFTALFQGVTGCACVCPRLSLDNGQVNYRQSCDYPVGKAATENLSG